MFCCEYLFNAFSNIIPIFPPRLVQPGKENGDSCIQNILAYCSSTKRRFHCETVENSELAEDDDATSRLLAALDLKLAATEQELFRSLQQKCLYVLKTFKGATKHLSIKHSFHFLPVVVALNAICLF